MSGLIDQSSIHHVFRGKKVKSSFTVFTQTENYEKAQMLLCIGEVCWIVSFFRLYQAYTKSEKDTVMEIRSQKGHSGQIRHLTEKSFLAHC